MLTDVTLLRQPILDYQGTAIMDISNHYLTATRWGSQVMRDTQ